MDLELGISRVSTALQDGDTAPASPAIQGAEIIVHQRRVDTHMPCGGGYSDGGIGQWGGEGTAASART